MRTQKQRQWNRLPTLLEELEQDRAFKRMLKSRFDQCCTTEALDPSEGIPRLADTGQDFTFLESVLGGFAR